MRFKCFHLLFSTCLLLKFQTLQLTRQKFKEQIESGAKKRNVKVYIMNFLDKVR